ncbi:MAG: RDD family protein, partial [Bacteroidales bacterium]|nr:RDD family protein [Bacteroidales bacterium]
MRKILEILTPENVYIEYELAGLGSRFIAYLIDLFIQVVFIGLAVIVLLFAGTEFIAYLIVQLGIMVLAFFVTVVLLLNLIYFIFFEMILKGQSPGKKIMKLRVIKQNGEPINLLDSFLRNLLRLFDMLPSYYLVGAVFVAFSSRCKRIGDFA